MQQPDDDLIDLIEDEPEAASCAEAAGTAACWKILVVDDDDEVHAATRFALDGAVILDRRLELISAHSAEEAKTTLEANQDVAVILLDVVMEEHDAGLKFAQWARAEGFSSQRIILRTGQPGYAPEMDVIKNYDINDYRAKSELTQTRLITAMTAAIRSFDQIETIEQSRRGLEMIVSSCNQLFQEREFSRFSEGVLLQLASLLHTRREGIICAGRAGGANVEMQVVSAIGDMSRYVGGCVGDLPDDDFLNAVRSYAGVPGGEPIAPAAERGRKPGIMFSVETRPDRRYLTCLNHDAPIGAIDAALLRVFAANIAAGFENVDLIGTLARRNADLERFAFAAAHDLQEPLRKIAVLADFVLSTQAQQLDDVGRDHLNTVHVSAAHMRKLVRGLLEYVTTSRDDLETEDAPLAEVVAEVETSMGNALAAAGVVIETGLLPAVRGDRASLARVLMLLFENAIAYRGAEPPRIRLSAQTLGDEVTLTVADNGRGFDPTRREEIFEAFKRLHRHAEIPGMGLGLSIAKRIVEHHGGTMWAESEPGQGARFHIQLPRARAAAAA